MCYYLCLMNTLRRMCDILLYQIFKFFVTIENQWLLSGDLCVI